MDNKVLNLCIEPEEHPHYLHQAHISTGGSHFSRDQTMQRLKNFGVYWPTMRESVNLLIKHCDKCQKSPPHHHATLFQITMHHVGVHVWWNTWKRKNSLRVWVKGDKEPSKPKQKALCLLKTNSTRDKRIINSKFVLKKMNKLVFLRKHMLAWLEDTSYLKPLLRPY